ncbi:U1-like zinc finger [Branchiostoma belcheri]|nr:U1-like zinc finger [Branchiostoma belcheri]
MSEIEEYLTESFDDKTSQEVPKVESNYKDAVEENIQEGTKIVDSESDSCKQGPSTPVIPTQDVHSSSPDVSSSGQVGPARRVLMSRPKKNLIPAHRLRMKQICGSWIKKQSADVTCKDPRLEEQITGLSYFDQDCGLHDDSDEENILVYIVVADKIDQCITSM